MKGTTLVLHKEWLGAQWLGWTVQRARVDSAATAAVVLHEHDELLLRHSAIAVDALPRGNQQQATALPRGNSMSARPFASRGSRPHARPPCRARPSGARARLPHELKEGKDATLVHP